jgi:hypothetical protein
LRKERPWESPAEIGAFVQLFVEERAKVSDPLQWHKVFSGWLFKTSPSLNVVQHPVYDVWVKDCAMKFPARKKTGRFRRRQKGAEAFGQRKPGSRCFARAGNSQGTRLSRSAAPARASSCR